MSLAYEADRDLTLESPTNDLTPLADLGDLEDEYTGDFSGYEADDFESLGVEPTEATGAKPGSEEKVMMLAARYAAGLPLWHDGDCYDHGPKRLSLPEDDEESLVQLLEEYAESEAQAEEEE